MTTMESTEASEGAVDADERADTGPSAEAATAPAAHAGTAAGWAGDLEPRLVRSLSSITSYRQAVRVFFSRPGPRVIAASAGAAWLVRAALGPPGPTEPLVCAAVAAWWPYQEWLMHRHLLHLRPKKTRWGTFDPVFAQRHRWHHEHPDDVDGTLLPPRVIYAGMPAAGAILFGLLGPRRRAVSAYATYSSMALLYEWTHFIVHTGIRPEHDYAKKLRRNHLLHHYRSEKHWLGFTAPIVDELLGTAPDPASVPRSKTAMDLHGLRAAAEVEHGSSEP